MVAASASVPALISGRANRACSAAMIMSPAPVMIATRSSASSRKPANTSPIARLEAASMAFALGRSITTSRTAPLRVTRTGPSLMSRPKRSQQLARDDVPLDLAGAVPNSLDPGVAPQPLKGQLVHQAHAPEDLNRPIGDAGEHLGRVELGLGDLAVGVHALVHAPGCGQGQVIGGVDLGDHVGQLEGDALKLADLLAKLPALSGMSERQLEGSARAPHTGRGDRQPCRPQPRIDEIETGALLTEHLRRGHATAVKYERAVVIATMRHGRVTRSDLHTWRAAVDQEARDPLLRSFCCRVLAGGDEDDKEVRHVRMTDEMLGSIDHPAVAVAPRCAF